MRFKNILSYASNMCKEINHNYCGYIYFKNTFTHVTCGNSLSAALFM